MEYVMLGRICGVLLALISFGFIIWGVWDSFNWSTVLGGLGGFVVGIVCAKLFSE